MEEFMTWEMLVTFGGLVSATYTLVEFTKELPIVRKISTKYWSWILALALIITANAVVGTFSAPDLPLYGINAILVSLSANGLHNFNNDKEKIELEEE